MKIKFFPTIILGIGIGIVSSSAFDFAPLIQEAITIDEDIEKKTFVRDSLKQEVSTLIKNKQEIQEKATTSKSFLKDISEKVANHQAKLSILKDSLDLLEEKIASAVDEAESEVSEFIQSIIDDMHTNWSEWEYSISEGSGDFKVELFSKKGIVIVNDGFFTTYSKFSEYVSNEKERKKLIKAGKFVKEKHWSKIKIFNDNE